MHRVHLPVWSWCAGRHSTVRASRMHRYSQSVPACVTWHAGRLTWVRMHPGCTCMHRMSMHIQVSLPACHVTQAGALCEYLCVLDTHATYCCRYQTYATTRGRRGLQCQWWSSHASLIFFKSFGYFWAIYTFKPNAPFSLINNSCTYCLSPPVWICANIT